MFLSRDALRHIKYGRYRAFSEHVFHSGRIAHLWCNPLHHLPCEPVPVHILCGRRQWTMLLWMLASWFEATQRNWRITVHDDGSLAPTASIVLTRLCIEHHILPRSESNNRVGSSLKNYTKCSEHRQRSPHALKLYDTFVYCTSDRYIVLDTDLLFYDKPHFVLNWVDGKEQGCYFMEDFEEANQISSAEARHLFAIDLWERVNSGICLIHREAIELELVDTFLRQGNLLDRNLWMVEQTLFALAASRYGNGGLLPCEYELSLADRMTSGSVMRHYVGAVRHLFYSEGVATLRPTFLQTLRT